MRTQSICLALVFVLLCPFASAQWTELSGLRNEDVEALMLTPGDTIFAGTNNWGANRSTDNGVNWWSCLGQTTYNVYEVYCLALAPSGNIFAGTYSTGLWRSTDTGHSWGDVSAGSGGLPEGDTYAVAINASGTVFASVLGSVYRSTDGGDNWAKVKGSSYGGLSGFRSIAFGGTDTVYICGTGDKFSVSTDNGLTFKSSGSWTSINPYVLAVNSKGTVFVGTSGGGVFKSTDGGGNFTAVNTNLGDYYINTLAIQPASDAILAGTSSGVFVSRDNGGAWTQYNSGLTHTKILAIAFDHSRNAYAGASTGSETGGVWRSNEPLPIELTSFTAQGSGDAVVLEWKTLSEVDNFGFRVERSSEAASGFLPISGLIPGHGTTNVPHSYTFTDTPPLAGNAFYYRLENLDLDGAVHYSDPISVDVLNGVAQEGTPTEYALRQNYPNPFNPTTTIHYALPRASHVTLSVHDMLGREVSVLVNEGREAGVHEVKFDGAGLSSGVYLYRLQAGDFVQSRKLILLK